MNAPSLAAEDLLGILLVSQIAECRNILVRDSAFSRRLFLLLVFIDKGKAKDQKDAELEAVGDKK